jgi:hypothetical protein
VCTGCRSYSLGKSDGNWEKLVKYFNFRITYVAGLIFSTFSLIMQMKW